MTSAHYKRDAVSYNHINSNASSIVVCAIGDIACIDGEQYLSRRNVYAPSNVNVSTNTYETYLQDTIRFKRLTAVPGVRLDYDNYMKNTNIAPRFSTSHDLWGDRSTELFGGVNRYYAGNVLAYKLRAARILGYYECHPEHVTATGSCSAKPVTTVTTPGARGSPKPLNEVNYNYTSLNTPYSDELNVGVQQRIYDTVWALKWVHHAGKD